MSVSTMAQASQITDSLRNRSSGKVQRLINNWDLLELMMEFDPADVDRSDFERLLRGQTVLDRNSTPHFGRFNPPEVLVAVFRRHNQELGLGFDDEVIDTLLGSIPVFAWNDPLTTPFIRWTLDDLKRSADAKLDLMKWVFGMGKVFVSDNFRTENLYLPEGAPPFQASRLEWGVIDLGNIRNTAPDQVDPTIAAGLEVFDASTQHPAHTRAHNGRDVPYLDVPGLRVKVPGYSRPDAPCVHGRSGGEVHVYAHWAGYASPIYGEPVLVRES